MKAVHRNILLTGLVMGALLLGGCSQGAKVPDEIGQTSLVIDKDGLVTSHMVDVFDQSHYDLDELRQMAAEEVAAYNTANQSGTTAPVTMVEAKKTPGDKVLVTYDYDGAGSYEDYNSTTLFYGTVAQARTAGYEFDSLNQVLFSTDGSKSIVSSELNGSDKDGKHVVILTESTLVYCPYKVAYASENAIIKEDGSVDTTAVLPEEYPVIILLDK